MMPPDVRALRQQRAYRRYRAALKRKRETAALEHPRRHVEQTQRATYAGRV